MKSKDDSLPNPALSLALLANLAKLQITERRAHQLADAFFKSASKQEDHPTTDGIVYIIGLLFRNLAYSLRSKV